MTELEFSGLAQQGYTRVPVVLEARADLYTPLAVYLKLASGPYTYLLESVAGGDPFGRSSFIGLACVERIEARGGVVRRLLREARGNDVCIETAGSETAPADPFAYVRDYLARDSQLQGLLSMAGPEFAPIVQQRFALAQQARERDLREERARLKEQRSFAIRDRATEKAYESDYAKNENLTTYLTSRAAEQFVMGQQPDPDALVEELRGLGKPLERARSIVNEAIFAGKGKALEIQRSDEGQYGKQPQVRSVEAEVERLLERFPNADPVKLKRDVTLARDSRLVRDPLAESILEENAEFAAQRGEAAPPIGPVWFEVGTKAGAQKFEERRNAQEKSLSAMERLEGTFGILSDRVASRQISRGRPPPALGEVLTAVPSARRARRRD